MAEFTIKGLKQVQKRLLQLEPKVARKVVRQALRKALKPVQARTKQLAPRGRTGQIARNVKVRARSRTRKGTIGLRVVIGRGDFTGEQFYASFVELGTKRSGAGYTRGLFGTRTRTPGQRAQHFMKRAYDQTKDQARATAIAEIMAGIQREARS